MKKKAERADQMELNDKRCLLTILQTQKYFDHNSKEISGNVFWSIPVRGKKRITLKFLKTFGNGDRKIMQPIKITSGALKRTREII